MSTTVGSHAVVTFTTPINGAALDATVVRGNINTLRTAYVAHDADTGIHVQSSLLIDRPAPGLAGRKWMTTDIGAVRLWSDNGSSWEEIDYAREDGPVQFTDLTVTGNTVLGNAATDTVVLNALVASDVVPSTSNTRDLGSTANRFKDLWLAGLATLQNLSVISGNTILRTVSYLWPASQGAAGTMLINDGSGNLSWSASVSDVGSVLYNRSTFR